MRDPEMQARRDRKLLVESLITASWGADKHKPVGTYINRLSPESREICKTLTAEDFQHWQYAHDLALARSGQRFP